MFFKSVFTVMLLMAVAAVAMNHDTMDHDTMNHGSMNHDTMDHSMHDNMKDHKNDSSESVKNSMHDGHSNEDHSMHGDGEDHSQHKGVECGMPDANCTLEDHSGHGNVDHSGHGNVDHSGHGNVDHSQHNGGGSHDDHSLHSDMPGMKMYFHTGYEEYVLFEDCLTESKGALVAACFIIFLVAVLYEGLKFLREMLLHQSLQRDPSIKYMDRIPGSSSSEQIVIQATNMSITSRMFSSSHLVQTFLHILQVFVSYCLMLVFMTYNIWLCLAVVLGAGTGYFLFGWKRAVVVDSNEHCH